MELELAFPFGLGVVAAFNPCGFAMLPAYLSYFLGLDDDEDVNRLSTIVRSLVVGLVLTAGFVVVFGGLGILFETLISVGTVTDYTGYFTATIGVLMVPLGIAMLLGKDINLRLPKMNKGTGDRQLTSVFMFGVSYAVISLSCTIPLFLAGVTTSFASEGWFEGVARFFAYGVGMGSVITFLTMSLALAKTNIAADMRRVLPYVGRISGFILILAGIYLVNYGVWEIQILDDPSASNPLVDRFLDMNAAVNNWISHTTPNRIAVLSLFGVLGALLIGWRDVEPDPVKRRSLTASYVVAWLIVEFGFNDGEFIVLPLLRFFGGWPARVGHWFTDPLRFGVPLEIAFTALFVWIVWRRVDRYRPAGVPEAVGAT